MLIPDNIEQHDDIWTSTEVLKYFYLPFNLYKHMTSKLRASSPRKAFLFNGSARHDMVRIMHVWALTMDLIFSFLGIYEQTDGYSNH